MRRILLDPLRRNDADDESIRTTPVRGSLFRSPRSRLLDRELKTDRAPVKNICKLVEDGASSKEHAKNREQHAIVKRPCAVDRFIPSRRGYSFDAANYLLTKKIVAVEENKILDVLGQVDSIHVTWKKERMQKALADTIPEMKQTQILRSCQSTTENKLAGSLVGKCTRFLNEGSLEDSLWRAKPRQKPLIGSIDSILDMPGQSVHPCVFDWGSTNLVATKIHKKILFYNINSNSTVQPVPFMHEGIITIKWSNSGDEVALSTVLCAVMVYSINVEKLLWKVTCKCLQHDVTCLIRCVCWSEKDKCVVTGCRGMVSIYDGKDGTVISFLHVHKALILSLTFSPNYRYLVSTAYDKTVRILEWPELSPFFDVTFYRSIKAACWHPHESGLLCVGGGEASLTLWNVNQMESRNYRRAAFLGIVEDLAWNKHSGELMVHWTYWLNDKKYTVIPVLASLDKFVDVLPVNKEVEASRLVWSPDHTQIMTHFSNCLATWNFFGYEKHHRASLIDGVTCDGKEGRSKVAHFKQYWIR